MAYDGVAAGGMAESKGTMPAPGGPGLHPSAQDAPHLEERERTVLAELAREVDAWVSFQGLRRQLRVHQQALVRTLRRLQQDGLVAHDGKGYQLTDKGVAALRGHAPARAASEAAPAPVTLLEALLPPHAGPGDVAAHLSRRWFGGLRWFGQSEGPGETALRWVAEQGGARVTVRVSAGAVTLEVAPDASGDPARGFHLARPVLAALAEVYGMPPRGPLHAYGGGPGFVA